MVCRDAQGYTTGVMWVRDKDLRGCTSAGQEPVWGAPEVPHQLGEISGDAQDGVRDSTCFVEGHGDTQEVHKS